MNKKPNYSPAILHFAGTAFKPWNGTYPTFLHRYQKKEQLRSMNPLRNGQEEYFYLWYEYAVMANTVLEKIGFRPKIPICLKNPQANMPVGFHILPNP